jgi:uncharacterized damage-inducible protein DinB
MFRTIVDFTRLWDDEVKATQHTFDAITDASMSQAIHNDHRTLGRIAWHTTGTIKEMMEKTGLHLEGPADNAPVPATAKAIAEQFATSARSLADAVRKGWTDETLLTVDDMYGEKWMRGQTLAFLILHQVHHRGQANVLMRQAGLKVPSIYGPTLEGWSDYQMSPPAV